jgi:hypothetical protein
LEFICKIILEAKERTPFVLEDKLFLLIIWEGHLKETVVNFFNSA